MIKCNWAFCWWCAGNSNNSTSVTVTLKGFHIPKLFWPIYSKLEFLSIAWKCPFSLFVFCINTQVQEKETNKKNVWWAFFFLHSFYHMHLDSFQKTCILRYDLVYLYGWEIVTFVTKKKVTTLIFLLPLNENVFAVLFDNFIVTW